MFVFLLCVRLSYLLDLTKQQVVGFAERVVDIAKDAGFVPTRQQMERDDVHATFTLQTEELAG